MASTSVAVAKTAAGPAVKVHPPASPFAALLRRSRFATFDPKIRQTYSTPPSHAARGSWGLKRPLALRRRNAFISLPAPFEHRAQFIEWTRAEDEVRFIRRFEEMQVRPRMTPKTPWSKTVGLKNSTNWLIDSEFAHRYEGPEAEEPDAFLLQEEAQKAQEARSTLQKKTSVDASLEEYGNAGQGNYGHRRALKSSTSYKKVSPNIDAMLPHEFDAYVRRLRHLRPKFQEYLRSHVVEEKRNLQKLQQNLDTLDRESTRDPTKKLDASNVRSIIEDTRKDALHPSTNLYQLAQMPDVSFHRRFIEDHTESQFADNTNSNGVVIEQRPHQVGGLLYSHPSLLHSQIFSTPQPGIILQNAHDITAPTHTVFIASFGGLSPTIAEQHRGDKTPLLNHNSTEGVKRENIKRSVAKMRLYPGTVSLERPPTSVAEDASLTGGLEDVKLYSQAMVAGSQVMFSQSNPYKPGTMEYVALQPVTGKGERGSGGGMAPTSSGTTPLMTPITRKMNRSGALSYPGTVNVRTSREESLTRWRSKSWAKNVANKSGGAGAGASLSVGKGNSQGKGKDAGEGKGKGSEEGARSGAGAGEENGQQPDLFKTLRTLI
ncbi:hypothetical protein GYMLUDRAFT_260077 [Collybiopsis luxurians FD-317 M1]|uniref:Uncharacterized protein n=1 Tax=Collybiopsis luxurians FD-317 M1 TaxID=944289 RepID=A0A0D0C3W8_9AGAR|nr:hypothetical protein GYMLUDRAFT_260077 [Collybiopsis luxurians FD-317 M1]